MSRRWLHGAPSSSFFCFDEEHSLIIPTLSVRLRFGESAALLGTKGTDIEDIYREFNRLDPLHMKRGAGRRVTRCVTRNVDLFLEYSALENFSMSERSFLPYNGRQLAAACHAFKKRFGIQFSFHTPLKQLSVSERILVAVTRACLSDFDVLICDNLLSLLTIGDRMIFTSIVQYLLREKKSLLYLTTKWEFAVQIASRVTVFSERSVLGQMETADVIRNPQRLVYLISGKSLVEQYSESTRTTEFLNMLYTGAEYLSENYELQGALSFVAENAAHLLGCVSCSISLSDPDSESIHQFLMPGVLTPVLTEQFLRSACTSETDVVYVSSDDLAFPSHFKSVPENVHALAAVPIVFRGKVCGCLAAFFETPVIYDEAQYLCLKSFAKETAIIAETSRLMGSSVLLQESNHRIKNNLQMIISLISIQQLHIRSTPDVSIDDVLDSIILRVQNIASIHELLTSRKGISHNEVDLNQLIRNVLQAYAYHSISIQLNCSELFVPLSKATAISMVINELVMNAIKYAFPVPRSENQIRISCGLLSESLCLEIEDNGCGLPAGVVFETSTSIGFSIIQTIVHNDLHGKISIRNTGHGTLASLRIPKLLQVEQAAHPGLHRQQKTGCNAHCP